MTQTHPIIFRNNHIFIEIRGKLWIYDTGSELTFGTEDVSLQGAPQPVSPTYMGIVSASDLSKFVKEEVAGIIGTDIVNRYDHIIDLKKNTLTVSDDELKVDGFSQPLEFFMGLPTLFAMIESRPRNFIFDTGAPICYYQGDIPPSATPGPIIQDFHPGFGRFESPSNFFNIELFGVRHQLQFGKLPGLIGMTLSGTNYIPSAQAKRLLDLMGVALDKTKCEGILGNELMRNRVTGYFPRRKELVLQS